jgi:hypothetical protein
MELEVANQIGDWIGAKRYERTKDRKAQFNGKRKETEAFSQNPNEMPDLAF